MAKETVLIHLDMLDVFDELKDEEIAELFKAIRAYLNGEEYIFQSRIARLSFLPMFRIFEINRKKYSKECERKSANKKEYWKKMKEIENANQEIAPPLTEQPSPPKPKPVSPHHANYDWIDPAFKECFAEWLDYKKKERKGTYKTEATLQKAYADLVKMSDGNPEIAREIVEKSMASGYMGLAPLKNNTTGNGYITQYERQKRSDEQLAEALARKSSIMLAKELAERRGEYESDFVPPPLFDH